MDHRKILGLPDQFTKAELKKAYKKQALIHHPDRNKSKSDDQIKKINVAYEYLLDNITKYRVKYKNSVSPKTEEPSPSTGNVIRIQGHVNVNGDGSAWDFVEVKKDIAASGGILYYSLYEIVHSISIPASMPDGYCQKVSFEIPYNLRKNPRIDRMTMKIYFRIV